MLPTDPWLIANTWRYEAHTAMRAAIVDFTAADHAHRQLHDDWWRSVEAATRRPSSRKDTTTP